jgi:site-specific DNA recombinase
MDKSKPKLKFFLYARKSSESEDRQMASIDSQVKELDKLAKELNLEVVGKYTESMSAKSPGRPVFNDMIARIQKGEANGIVCWKINRLARNPIDGGIISWLLQEKTVRQIQTYGRCYNSDDNVIMMSVELGMANQFVRDLSIDSKRGTRSKAERGWYPAFAPLGYLNTKDRGKGKQEIINDPIRFMNVRKIFDLMLIGCYSVLKIRSIVNDEWRMKNQFGRKIAVNSLYKILSHPFYYGEFEYPRDSGNWYKGKHNAMITKKEYAKIQIILGRKDKQRPKDHDFPFTGMIRCGECGAMITAEDKVKIQKNGNVHNYTYYHCTKRTDKSCSQKTVRDGFLEDQIIDKLEEIEIPKTFSEWTVNEVTNIIKKESNDNKYEKANLTKEQNQYSDELRNLIKMRTKNEIDEEEFGNMKKEIKDNIANLKERINNPKGLISERIMKLEKSFSIAESARQKFPNATNLEKKLILSQLGSNLSLKDKNLSVEEEILLLLIKEIKPTIDSLHDRLEPLKTHRNKRTLRVNYSQSPEVYRLGESNSYF